MMLSLGRTSAKSTQWEVSRTWHSGQEPPLEGVSCHGGDDRASGLNNKVNGGLGLATKNVVE